VGGAARRVSRIRFDKVFNVNVKGVFLLTRALTPMLRAGATDEDPARVINTGSVDGIIPPGRGRDNFSYSASKAGLIGLTRVLAAEGADHDIKVNAIAPIAYTRMLAHSVDGATGREAVENHAAAQAIVDELVA
jgi:NAD(P)-dependent dehydrogenase (short-subunit alcohol dehydrogenase family)